MLGVGSAAVVRSTSAVIEEKREEIRADYLVALDVRKQGRTKSGSVNDLFGAL